jgi:ribosome biogenesis GTPase / thiamine phosphate phosphatase
MANLTALGWNAFFDEVFEPHRKKGLIAGRVVLEHRRAFRIYTESDELLAEISGRVRYDAATRAELPAVGDWVAVTAYPNEKRATIHAILPRRSKFSRKVAGRNTEEQIVAANVDTVFLLVGLDGDYNLRRVERYLVAAWESGASPVIILSKLDLCEDGNLKTLEVQSIAGGVPVHAISSVTSEGLDAVNQYMGSGLTVAFLGSSGVGKSTLINRLVGKNIQKVKEVREHDSRGKHTTTHRELILLPTGGLLIDTPGMRELQLWEADGGLSETFEDIESVAAHCHFSNCRHQEEPGCAVREGLEDGSLSAPRYESYQKIQKELAFLETRQDTRASLERKQRDKKAHKEYRRIKPKRA